MLQLNAIELEELLQALEKVPKNKTLRKIIADVLLEQESFEEAKFHYELLAKQEPDNPNFQISLANIFFQIKKYPLALVILEALEANNNLTVLGKHLYEEIILRESGEEPENDADISNNDTYNLQIENNPLIDNDLDSGLESYSLGVEEPSINFEDVGGMENVKEEIRFKIIYPLTHPEISEAYNKKVGGGILLYGPPGCGKTHIARATAGEVQSQFISVALHEILDMWAGTSERNLHDIFELSRQQTPCVLFFDEVEALGANRTDMKKQSTRYLINQFLLEMDGIEIANDGLLILAATNRPWYLDPAFHRPGRFDKVIFVPPPDEAARIAILTILLKKVYSSESLNLNEIAKLTVDFSGADLQAAVNLAVEIRMKMAMKAGKVLPLIQEDLRNAVKQIYPSTKTWFNTAKNYALYSNDDGLYDDILKYLNIKKEDE